MNRTKIPWATHVWNPLTGCSAISSGCDHCYAKAIARRFHRPWGKPVYKFSTCAPVLASRPKKPARVFVCSVSDLFHDQAPVDAQSLVWDVAHTRPDLTFIVLTKRSGNMERKLAGADGFGHGVLPNMWLGVSVEANEARFRVDDLVHTPAAVRVVSVEPMLGPVDLKPWLRHLDWVICGPETGPGCRRFEPQWLLDVKRDCKVAGVPFFDKRDEWKERQYPKGGGRGEECGCG